MTALRLTTPRRRLRAALVAIVLAVGASLLSASPALAYQPVGVVHTETVQAGPYTVTVGYSTWPIRAMQSLDFTFAPSGGIAGKSGTLLQSGPGIPSDQASTPLVRHPRKLSVWGLDVVSLDTPGVYKMGFVIHGPQGTGTGYTQPFTVLAQPGPPLGLSWLVCSIPFAAIVALIVVAWRRTSAGKRRLAV